MLRIKQESSFSTQQPEQQYVPLKKVSVEAYIKSFAADVTVKQIFRNDETKPIEAVYCFPIEEQAAIYSFVARIDDREIIAQLKEKKEAQREYNDALQQGHGAYLLEQDEKSQDNFIINVGALPPGKECHIHISYVSELDLVQNGSQIRFVIPTTIAPRYNPNKGGISSPFGTTSKYVQTAPYTIEFHCRVEKANVSRISSMSHPIQVEVGQENVYVIAFAQQNTHLDRDILIDIELAGNRSNTISAVEPGAVMASFIPTEEDCQRVMNNVEMTNEFIFVVDCSGSMEDENKIGLAREAMLLFLKSLPVDCHFNIIRFGSNHVALFKEITSIYNEQNAQKAEQLTKHLRADLGGTELLGPLQWLEQHPPGQGRARQIFLLTDGEISNVNEVLDLCRSMATSTRIFSFGLGHSPSRSLVKGLARATNGRFVFIPPNSSVDIYVGEQLQKALQSCITNIEVKWNLGTNVMSAPTKMPPVYVNDRLIAYALASDPMFVFDHNPSVELLTDKSRLGRANVDTIPNVSVNGTIARLAAKALILELQHSKLPSSVKQNISGSLQSRFQEDRPSSTPATTIDEKEIIKKRIIELSLKYQILSPYTAFIGVEKRMNASNVDMVLREIPIQISADDEHLQVSQVMNFPACMMPSPPMMNRSMLAPMSMASIKQSTLNWDMDCANLRSMSQVDLLLNDLVYKDCLEAEIAESDDLISSTHSSNYPPISSYQQSLIDQDKSEAWPIGDQNIVRYLINKQKFDGLWDLNTKSIEQLTGKSLTNFPSFNNQQILITAIVVVALETRFATMSTMWHGVVQKARKRLLDLLGKDAKQLQSLLESIRQQF
ncbi:unnamed protein product [Rotaria sordida]|uniref:Uncharacterized protein n=1 Tax=Rotaria sordida TaxID=392033 RepID=A0A814FCG9_9BILA|nr:unnamed protein product [Rotaria sordida]CAF0926634.1 unnamed protein product [Rotaria sordida]CAF0980982.1 unnamed protein product [Rotaria sordida]CAF1045637.1 unnamed protein product [Rotaria sordida]CAF3646509.1 unnamed protein product [Rotaria sordida]